MNPILIIGIGTYPVQVLQRTFKNATVKNKITAVYTSIAESHTKSSGAYD